MANRPHYIWTSDGHTCPDDLIPRCADAANSPSSVFNYPDVKRLAIKSWSPVFLARIEDAKRRLSCGEHPDRIRESHGAIVVRQAAAELLPKAKMLA